MKVIMPLPHIVQVKSYNMLLLEISCNDSETASKVYDHYCSLIYGLFNRTGEVTEESLEKFLTFFKHQIEINYLNQQK